ncbi:MAG: amidohydrolase, partial [Thermoanaerobaculia bacterium]|nr:amidohydrolase [Thermoanaerobaculia bacterium]
MRVRHETRLGRVAALALALAAAPAPPLAAQTVADRAEAELDGLLSLYRELHARPELSFQEKETAATLAGELRGLGFTVTEGVGDYDEPGLTAYGLVAVIENGEGPTVMVRTDLDGLPVAEKTGLPYASRHTGLDDEGREVATMHACGHDLHMTAFVGTARLLTATRDRWSGTLVMIGQPAEERGAGARAMLADGLFERFPKPDYALALHTHAGLASGRIGLVPGYAMANVDSVDIRVRGRGGHGAYPHTTKDPVTLAALIVTGLQTVVSRQVSPFDPAVITVGSIHGGTKHNVIPDEVRLQLTVRSYRPEVREYLLASIARTARETALAAGFPEELLPEVVVREETTPAVFNDPDLVARLERVFTTALGAEAVTRVEPVMAGEDFARYHLEGGIPAVLFWLGAIAPERVRAAADGGAPLPSLHSSELAPLAPPAIRAGVIAMTSAVLDLMAPD